MPLFNTHIAVDWSARSKRSPKRPSKDAIWYCVVKDGIDSEPVYRRTRAKAAQDLICLIQRERAAGRRVLVGFDFPFGYPKGVSQKLTGQTSALALWDWLSERIEDDDKNENNRYQVATEINNNYEGLGPCWGRPKNWDYPKVPTRKKVRHGHGHPPECRIADDRAKAKTVWQLYGAGSVGSQVLLGLPIVSRLRADTEAEVWPFDTGLQVPKADVVLAEIYPSLLQMEAHERRGDGQALDAAQVRVTAKALAQLDKDEKLAALFTPTVKPDERKVIEQEEAWILGLGFEDELKDAAR